MPSLIVYCIMCMFSLPGAAYCQLNRCHGHTQLTLVFELNLRLSCRTNWNCDTKPSHDNQPSFVNT